MVTQIVTCNHPSAFFALTLLLWTSFQMRLQSFPWGDVQTTRVRAVHDELWTGILVVFSLFVWAVPLAVGVQTAHLQISGPSVHGDVDDKFGSLEVLPTLWTGACIYTSRIMFENAIETFFAEGVPAGQCDWMKKNFVAGKGKMLYISTTKIMASLNKRFCLPNFAIQSLWSVFEGAIKYFSFFLFW